MGHSVAMSPRYAFRIVAFPTASQPVSQSVSQSISQPIQIVLPASSEPIPHCLPNESEMDYKKKHQATRPHLWPCTKFQNFFVIMEYEQQWGEMRTTVAYILITKQSAEICHCTYIICS